MRTANLEDLVIEIIDHRGKTPKKLGTNFVRSGVPIASAQLVNGGVLDLSDCRFVDEATWQRWMPIPLRVDDILLTSEAPLGRTARVQSSDPLVLGQRLFALRTRADLLDSAYLYYWLSSRKGQTALAEQATGSTVLGIRQSALRRIKVPVPAMEEQRAIGEVLGALDDNIAANRRVIAGADELVAAIYSGTTKSDNGRCFFDVADVGGGGTPSTKIAELWDDSVQWATPTDVTGTDGPWLMETSRKISDEGLVACASPLYPAGSILMTSRATIGGTVLAHAAMAVNQGFIVINAEDSQQQWWLESQVRARTKEFESWANGATFLEISRGTFKNLPVHECSGPDLKRFNDAVEPIRHRQAAAQIENRILARTRDELLPLLMSGKITVQDAERAVGDVL